MADTTYLVEDYDLAEMQRCELELLDEFDRVCTLHDIPYFLAYGTLLGAARHEGFIPWDDDIDLFVFARDLPRLREAMAADLDHERFFYQCEETDPAFNMTITRLRLNGTTALNVENAERDMHQGVFIDVYPLHEMAPGKAGRFRQKCWSMVDCLLTVHREPLNHGTTGRVAYHVGMALLDHPGVHEKARRERDRHLGSDDAIICSLCSGWSTIDREFPPGMFGTDHLPFEGRTVPVPSGWRQLLEMRYGDWTQLPPESERHGSHTIYFFDAHHSYEDYRGKKYLLKGVSGS